MRPLLLRILLLYALLGAVPQCESQNSADYLDFVRSRAAELRKDDRPPATPEEWRDFKDKLRENLNRAWGEPTAKLGDLRTQSFGILEREGYAIEKLAIQTFPGVWMTANAYVPDGGERAAAILMVHGHWRGAKQDPVVQARCIGAAKQGFFVLAVDAFGAGERGVNKALGEYHGEMTAATLLPAGLTLSGLQVAENVRAAEYLRQRPEVDSERIGITGASGGGNQTMYAAAWDERFLAVAPVCSVGNYQAYLGAACCYCELVPGALRFTEEWGVLGMIAPRALLVINATRDARQFSVAEAAVSLDLAGSIFRGLGKPANLRHAIFESGHDYSKPMRETVYGWMSLHLKDQGDGGPVLEGDIRPEDPESLRCFSGDSRPADWITIPRFAAAEARRVVRTAALPRAGAGWIEERKRLTNILARDLLGGFPAAGALDLQVRTNQGRGRQITFSPEPGIVLKATQQFGRKPDRLMIVLDLEGAEKAASSEAARIAAEIGWSTLTLDLRATGSLAWPDDRIGRAPDHTTAQWAFWIGRPLLGQWTWDLCRLLDALQEVDGALPKETALAGIGPAGIVALCAAVLEGRITRGIVIDSLVTFITEVPYEKQRMGIILPGVLKHLGDVSALAALAAPKPLLIAGGVRPDGREVGTVQLSEYFGHTSSVFTLLSGRLEFADRSNLAEALPGFLENQ